MRDLKIDIDEPGCNVVLFFDGVSRFFNVLGVKYQHIRPRFRASFGKHVYSSRYSQLVTKLVLFPTTTRAKRYDNVIMEENSKYITYISNEYWLIIFKSVYIL